MRTSDEALLLAARRGDPDCFGAFYERYGELVTAYLRRRLDQPEVVLDLTAEVFAAALNMVADTGRSLPENSAAWLFGVAHNKYVDALRRGRTETAAREAMKMEVLVIEVDDLAEVDRLASEGEILRLLDRLPPAQEAAVRARVLDEQPYAELAARLECSNLVARQRVSRGLRTLRNLMGVPHD